MMRDTATGINWSGGNNVPWEDQLNPSVQGSQAWIEAGGGSSNYPTYNDGYGADYQRQDTFGMAGGGVIDRLMVPSGDDGFYRDREGPFNWARDYYRPEPRQY